MKSPKSFQYHSRVRKNMKNYDVPFTEYVNEQTERCHAIFDNPPKSPRKLNRPKSPISNVSPKGIHVAPKKKISPHTKGVANAAITAKGRNTRHEDIDELMKYDFIDTTDRISSIVNSNPARESRAVPFASVRSSSRISTNEVKSNHAIGLATTTPVQVKRNNPLHTDASFSRYLNDQKNSNQYTNLNSTIPVRDNRTMSNIGPSLSRVSNDHSNNTRATSSSGKSKRDSQSNTIKSSSTNERSEYIKPILGNLSSVSRSSTMLNTVERDSLPGDSLLELIIDRSVTQIPNTMERSKMGESAEILKESMAEATQESTMKKPLSKSRYAILKEEKHSLHATLDSPSLQRYAASGSREMSYNFSKQTEFKREYDQERRDAPPPLRPSRSIGRDRIINRPISPSRIMLEQMRRNKSNIAVSRDMFKKNIENKRGNVASRSCEEEDCGTECATSDEHQSVPNYLPNISSILGIIRGVE